MWSALSTRMIEIFSVCPLAVRWCAVCKAAARYDFKNSLLKSNLFVINGTSFSKIHVVFLLPEIFQVTSAASDPELSFTIISCFISPNSNPAVASDYTLIEMVCPKDDSVKFYPQRDVPFSRAHVEKKRFAFKFNSKFNLSLLFLHCEMSLCSKTSQTDSKLPPVSSVILLLSFILMNIITLWFYVSWLNSTPSICRGKSSIILIKNLSFFKLYLHSAWSPMTPVIPFPWATLWQWWWTPRYPPSHWWCSMHHQVKHHLQVRITVILS